MVERQLQRSIAAHAGHIDGVLRCTHWRDRQPGVISGSSQVDTEIAGIDAADTFRKGDSVRFAAGVVRASAVGDNGTDRGRRMFDGVHVTTGKRRRGAIAGSISDACIARFQIKAQGAVAGHAAYRHRVGRAAAGDRRNAAGRQGRAARCIGRGQIKIGRRQARYRLGENYLKLIAVGIIRAGAQGSDRSDSRRGMVNGINLPGEAGRNRIARRVDNAGT